MSDPHATPPSDPTAAQVPPQYGTPPASGQVPPAQVPPQYAGQTTAPAAPLSQSDDKLWASLAHFGGVLNFIPPLIIWLVLKDRGPLTNQEGKESLNYQITIAIAWIAQAIIGGIVGWIPVLGWLIVLLLTLAVSAAQLVFPIIAGVKVQGGGTYRYPFAIRFIK